jgi:chromosome segregation ATPase
MLVAFCLQPSAALPLDWRSLDTPKLLAEAARRIETLQRLNETLRQQIRASLEQSATLEARLATLQTDWEKSEKLRMVLENALMSLQRSLQNCREEAKAKARREMLEGLAAGVAVGVVVRMILSGH